jgi:hypothetical protein
MLQTASAVPGRPCGVGFAVGVDGAYVGCAERCWRAIGWLARLRSVTSRLEPEPMPDKEDEQPEDAAAGDTDRPSSRSSPVAPLRPAARRPAAAYSPSAVMTMTARPSSRLTSASRTLSPFQNSMCHTPNASPEVARVGLTAPTVCTLPSAAAAGAGLDRLDNRGHTGGTRSAMESE